MKRSLRVLALLMLSVAAASAQELPTGTPESVGMSGERLERMHKGMQGFVDRKEAGGIITLVAREGRVVDVRTYGMQDAAAGKPMRPDTIFRIFSMSKPVTSVAVMMLYEEGRILLTDPISKYIPSLKSPKVLVRGDGGATSTVPAKREITIRDLLSHRSGLTYGFLDAAAVGDGYRKNGVSDGLMVTPGTIGENIDRLAKEPLVSQPGAEWHYSLSTDVLGRLVEVVSGQPFDVFLRERIFKPLQMVDTSFEVPDAKRERFAAAYTPDAGGVRPMKDPEAFGNTVFSPESYYKPGKKYFSGGAGLVSTIRDYSRFAQMLLDGGVLGGVRLLGPKTVELMASSHTSDIPPTGLGLIGEGGGFGLGFRVSMEQAANQTLGSPGMYGWSGIMGTNFWVDPKEKLFAVMMVQRYPGAPIAASFQALTYQSIVEMEADRVARGASRMGHGAMMNGAVPKAAVKPAAKPATVQ
jgi:CubicO group peptidase (beta-lactamase class C family)